MLKQIPLTQLCSLSIQTVPEKIESSKSRLVDKNFLQWSIYYPKAKNPHEVVKMQQKLAFLLLLPFVIYVSGSDPFNLPNFLKLFKLFDPDDGKRGHFKFRNISKGLF